MDWLTDPVFHKIRVLLYGRFRRKLRQLSSYEARFNGAADQSALVLKNIRGDNTVEQVAAPGGKRKESTHQRMNQDRDELWANYFLMFLGNGELVDGYQIDDSVAENTI